MPEYRVFHRTSYRYHDEVTQCHNEVHLIPRQTAHQVCTEASLKVFPEPEILEHRTDYYGNNVSYFTLDRPHRFLEVGAESLVKLTPAKVPELENSPVWTQVRDQIMAGEFDNAYEIQQFVCDSPKVLTKRLFASFASISFEQDVPLLVGCMDLTRRIFQDFKFEAGSTNVSTPSETVLRTKRGVCQDFAHLALSCLRSIGLAARYVSGYLETLPPPGKEKLLGSDVSHAWISVWCPNHGWIDFDPTNNQVPYDRHITLAWGRDYDDITPLKGILFGGGKMIMKVSVDVERLPII